MNPTIENLIITSVPENIVSVENYVEKLCSEYDVDDSVFGNMLISITEAVNNAIIHGNQRDPKKMVTIAHTMDLNAPRTLTIKIVDEGKGFDYLNLPDPTAPENIEMMGGRGVFLIKQLADVVIFSDKGESIELQFRV